MKHTSNTIGTKDEAPTSTKLWLYDVRNARKINARFSVYTIIYIYMKVFADAYPPRLFMSLMLAAFLRFHFSLFSFPLFSQKQFISTHDDSSSALNFALADFNAYFKCHQ